jgi:DNA-binding MarR family transcriptional regulator
MAGESVVSAAVDDDVAEFAALLSATTRHLKRAGPPPDELREAVERAALGKRHTHALLAIAAAGPISVSDLAKRLGLLLSSTSTIVGQLDRAELVERSEDDEDRRRTIVRLDARYREAMKAWLETAMKPVRETFEDLSPEARAHFMQGWRMLHDRSARSGSSDAEGGCED